MREAFAVELDTFHLCNDTSLTWVSRIIACFTASLHRTDMYKLKVLAFAVEPNGFPKTVFQKTV